MENFTRILHNAIAEIQVQHDITLEEACDEGIKILEDTKHLRELSKGIATNDYIYERESE